ncbi:response regulator transcription factor [Aureibaculum sp. A20]|uniref:Response regulator transcription factor n=1 Tax=Aureibaculum flavum TaxID=2795986 RepID=A0ABS0WWE2_9FLAO|nr:response regulator transcription factor [Aureibaculum flavum]MBJ2176314.1 response regulator transcription factor [Aureibaculum flavum]
MINILIVDDNPMIIEAYKSLFNSSDLDCCTLNIDVACDCEGAISKMKLALSEEPYNCFYFDMNLPPSLDGNYKSGEDLALFAKENFPKAKVAILTLNNDSLSIHNILTKIKPDGLLIKNDSNPAEFINGFKTIMTNPPFYSTSVIKFLSNISLRKESDKFDDNDIKILMHLEQGIKTKDLDQYINLSLSSIEKKKSQLKKSLNLNRGNDEDLVRIAKEKGLI